MKKYLSLSSIARIIAALMLFYALERQPYDYYTLLRWVTFGASSYSALIAYKAEKTEWAVILGITGLLFNPLIPVNLRRETWVFIDLAAGVLLLVSLLFVQRDLESPTAPAVTTNEPLILHQWCLFDMCSHKCSKCSMEFVHGCKVCLPNNPNATECTYWIGPDKSFMCGDCLYGGSRLSSKLGRKAIPTEKIKNFR